MPTPVANHRRAIFSQLITCVDCRPTANCVLQKLDFVTIVYASTNIATPNTSTLEAVGKHPKLCLGQLHLAVLQSAVQLHLMVRSRSSVMKLGLCHAMDWISIILHPPHYSVMKVCLCHTLDWISIILHPPHYSISFR